MENNKLLIGVQFTYKDESGKDKHTNIELYVLRDITLYQLLSGIKYGVAKLSNEDQRNSTIYQKCNSVYKNCVSKVDTLADGRQYLTHITFTSFNQSIAGNGAKDSARFSFFVDDIYRPICELGFINSSRLIFDETGTFTPQGRFDTSNIIEAFNPQCSKKIFFPEYNISTRQLWQFDNTPVDIIAPTDPPKKPNRGLFEMLLPSTITVGVLLIVRSVFMSGGIAMLALSAAMGITAAITTVMTWKRQKKEYAKSLSDWRNQYQNYIDRVISTIKNRQQGDVAKMHELYPDMLSLINRDGKGVYSLNEHIYCRAPQDEDFLSFRIGISDDVRSKFDVKGEKKDVVFSEASYDLVQDNCGNDRLRLYLRDEISGVEQEKENLCKLPNDISNRYRYLKNAPLLYSLKNKGALGIVDHDIDNVTSKVHYFISRMIFELCYYHSPENLQFVVFFEDATDWDVIENTINRYKFMPHFRGLFTDKSQFVFDNNSASMVLSSLLTMLGNRKANSNEGEDAASPHIVFIVFNEHGLKEHAFAEFLPKAPNDRADFVNNMGLTFVFASKYKEYLPAYCDDIVNFDGNQMTLTPRNNVGDAKAFRYPTRDSAGDIKQFFAQYTTNVTRALRFFSSVYYAQIAQNGKVPSAVGLYELFGDCREDLEGVICSNWGCGQERAAFDVTRSLSVPIGKTETGLAFLDLHEKADGPHMLVAGTTGSGKTETIISYLLGLCMQYRPDELNLLLVDMKGGGFTKRIGHLPHVVGSVTDVDGDENGTGAEYMLGRFLFAMKSEIKRRKLLFNKLHVDSIDAYIQACHSIDAHIEKIKVSTEEAEIIRTTAKESPLSHLVLVVDEFTELKRFSSENNDLDFMGEITTIARVGRSLGFHIILISQNIEGAITEDIRVNSNARLCLKVATRQASKDMLGTELAASPSMPGNGRAYLLVGTGSKFEYFQSGYSGAGVEDDIPVEIVLASKSGAYSSFYRSDRDNKELIAKKAKQKQQGNSKTQLESITEAICSAYAHEKATITTPHIVFRAPLPTCVALDNANNIVDLSKKKDR